MIELPFPHKILWPNGRTRSPHYRAREFKKHKNWAQWAAFAHYGPVEAPAGRLRLIATFYPKTRHVIDKDNASSSLKAYQDGVARALGVDDKHFDEPSIIFGEPVKGGKVILIVEGA